MVLEKLGNSLKSTLHKITKAVFIDERLINELIKDIQRALLQGDVNVKLVFELTKTIKERALKEKPPVNVTEREHLIKIVYEELVKFLGDETRKIEIKKKPTQVMLVGLFGNGKTTTAAKLANYYQKRAFKVALLQLDCHRPAAYEQLQQLAKQTNTPFFGDKKEKNPVNLYKKFKNELKKFDLVILDTAGRDALSDDLIEELNKLNDLIKPDENLLVMGADVGQTAQVQAQKFNETCNITGVIITKLDGTAKGGGALSACSVTDAPVMFIGIGEKINDFEIFNPKGFVGRLLGMGDIEALLEKAKEVVTEEEAKDLSKKLLKGEFNLIDLYSQMEAMSKMGPIGKIIEMVPGLAQIKMPKELLQVQESKLKKWRHIMNSMTKEELEDPEIITGSRVERIARGSGCSTSDVRELIKQYRQSKKLIKMMKGKGKGIEKMMKKFGGRVPGLRI